MKSEATESAKWVRIMNTIWCCDGWVTCGTFSTKYMSTKMVTG